MNYQTRVLPSGLRVIYLPSEGPVVYCGITLSVGTRHERPGQEGLAHFCEHLAFKGTKRRSAMQIINAIEGAGGELNAFTNKEDTTYYCAVPKKLFPKAVDVLFDIVFHSAYPDEEVEKEREVVCEEIESYEDTPSELIFDEFENRLFSGHPLGHNILGSSSQVRGYTAADARAFTAEHYRPERAVFFVSGSIISQLDNLQFDNLQFDNLLDAAQLSNCKLLNCEMGEVIVNRGTHQAHVMIGAQAFSADDPRRWGLYLLCNILGGPGLNSRLNLALRERAGLVYDVECAQVSYGDTGLWSIYYGCDPHDVKRCMRLVRHELERLMDKPLGERQLRQAKQQLQGQLCIASDNREQFALDFAKTYLHHGTERSLADIMRHIDALTAEELQTTARLCFDFDHTLRLIYQ